MKFRPIGKVVVLKQLDQVDVLKADVAQGLSLHMPDIHDNQDIFSDDEWNMKRGEVIAIGEEVTQVKVGDKVIVKQNSLVSLSNKREKELLGIIYESDILVIMEDLDEQTS